MKTLLTLVVLMLSTLAQAEVISTTVSQLQVDTSLISCVDAIPFGSRSGSTIPGHLRYESFDYSRLILDCQDFIELQSSGVLEVEVITTVDRYTSVVRRHWGAEVTRSTATFKIGTVVFKNVGPEIL